MIAYISLSFSQRGHLEHVVNAIRSALNRFAIGSHVFTDLYTFGAGEEKKMMRQALADIDRCSLLIAETSDKAIGIGIEAGYARAKGKPVVYIRHHAAEHSTTLAGISEYQVIYRDVHDLQNQLTSLLQGLVGKLTGAPATSG